MKPLVMVIMLCLMMPATAALGLAAPDQLSTTDTLVTKDGTVIAGPSVPGGVLHAGPLKPQKAQSSAKLAVLIGPDTDGPEIYRAKGVAEMTNPATGIFCILPKPGTGLFVNNIVPVLTVEWGISLQSVSNGMYAYYLASGSDCPAGYIEVKTYDDNYGNPILTDGIAFTMIVQ